MSVFVISFIDVKDHELYKKYTALAPDSIEKYGGRYIVRNGTKYPLEGSVPNRRFVVLEFPSVERVHEWHDSPEYKRALELREACSNGDIFVVEGYDPARDG